MRAEIKELWLEALRSGRYEQGNGVLFDATHNQFCCLGVLCDLAATAGVIAPPVFETQAYVPINAQVPAAGLPTRKVGRYGATDEGSSIEELPIAVALWAGLTVPNYSGPPLPNTNPSITRETEYDDEYTTTDDTLAELNDSHTPFTILADLIQEYL